MAFRQIKTPALADQAVITAKLDVTAVSGHSAVTSLIGADELMVHDSANGALKKITSANLIGSYDSDDLGEGSTNQYFTDARVRTSVDSYLSGGTGVAVASGAISIGQAVATTSNVTFNNVAVDGTLTTDDITAATVTASGNMIVGGNLTVQGTTTSVNSTTVEISDNILVLNKDATSGIIDAGITVERGSDGDKSFIWDETNDRWSTGGESLAAALIGTVVGNVTGTVSSIANHDTDDLSEGSANLYWTQARFNTAIAAADTDSLSEGSTNLYYTDARANSAFDTRLATKTSDNLTEGSTNLYFTTARANAVIAGASVGDLSDVDISSIADGNTIVWDNGNSTFTTADHFDMTDFNAAIAALDTNDIAEGTNLYFTTARARSSISAGGSLAYNSTTGVMSYTERTNSAIETLARGALSATGDLTYNSATGAFGVVTFKNADWDTRLATKTTDNLAEGSSNLYYTDARVASYLGTNSYATETYVDAAVTAVIDAAPAALDTLNELAASLNDDANFAGTMTTNLATKLALAGGTMAGNIAMGSNLITGLAAPIAGGDAANKTYVDGQVSTINSTISGLDTDDVAEGSNLYWTSARGIVVADARIALANVGDLADVNTTGAAADKFLKYNGSAWVVGDAAAAILELSDVSDTTFTAKADYVLQVNAGATGMELVDPAVVVWGSQNRIVINGSGVATYSLGFTGSQSHAHVFVGGVIQDPATHYTITGSSITFTANIPAGTQAVVINPAVASVPVLQSGSVTSTQIAGTDVKAYVQGSDVAVTGATTIDTFAGGTYRSAKYIMQVDDGAGNYESREALVVHDGTTAYITEFAMVYTGSDLIGDASVTMSGSDVLLQYTPTTGSATVKVIATYIDV
tara:strand:+ start:2699 stop:5314 length:2616 start_codon:yes stop_codon:yes gene_type:complete